MQENTRVAKSETQIIVTGEEEILSITKTRNGGELGGA